MEDRKSIEKTSFEQIETTREIHNDVPEVLRNCTPEQLASIEKKLVRRIDLRALPVLVILFLLNVLDRNAIANARLGGLEATLGIDDVQYQTAVMVLWAGYISMMVCIGSRPVRMFVRFDRQRWSSLAIQDNGVGQVSALRIR